MAYLIDTHILIWLSEESPRLSQKIEALLRDMRNEVYVSVASLWEIAIKVNLGKLKIRYPIDKLVPETYDLLDITPGQLLDYVALPPHHRDPFDRLLIAQAKHHKLTLVTQDARFKAYKIKTLIV